MADIKWQEALKKLLTKIKEGSVKLTPKMIADAQKKLGIEPEAPTPTPDVNLNKRKRINRATRIKLFNKW